jgi:hypothetical protein
LDGITKFKGVLANGRTRRPGTLLGPRTSTCSRCGREFPEDRLSTIPPKAKPGDSRIYVCESCE